jgi:hypothetical protein
MLEQNGFERACLSGDEERLLDYNANKLQKGGKKRAICYLCGEEAGNKNHSDLKSPNYHVFKVARYILFFGESKDIIKISREEALSKFCSNSNKYGEEIKIFIGTRTISEGLDFKRLRQVHILEPWYNLSRHEQIIGRAIRNMSHSDLLPDERNVEIYQYAAVLDNKIGKLSYRESVDLKNYRIAENKDVIIKKITRIMKESAVDCVLFRNTNIIKSNKKVKQITSSGEILYVPISDKPYTSICDYNKDCNYSCNWMPNPRINYPINTDTYNIRFSSNDIEKIKKEIKNMFRENIVYYLATIENNILQNNPNIDKLFIYSALEDLVNNKNEIIYDKFSRKGYIIYRGDYYIFQPFDLERDELPMIYRMNPTSINPEYIDLENIELNYLKNNKSEDKIDHINEYKLVEIFIERISSIYNLHIEIIKENDNTKHKKNYIYAIIGLLYDKLNHNEEFLFIKNVLIMDLNKTENLFIKYIIDFLNINNKLINYYADLSYDISA